MKFGLSGKLLLTLAFLPIGNHAFSSVEIKNGIKKPNPLVLLDWDDTILPTSKIEAGLNSEQIKKMKELDKVVTEFIESFLKQNIPVVIASNGSGSWLAQSAAEHLPLTYKLLCKPDTKTNCASIVSAKDYYEGKFPQHIGLTEVKINDLTYQTPVLWKYEFFKDYLSGYNPVFSVGDGAAEQSAMQYVFTNTPSVHITLPLKPNIDTIKMNLQYILASYTYISSQNLSSVLTGCNMDYIYKLFLPIPIEAPEKQQKEAELQPDHDEKSETN